MARAFRLPPDCAPGGPVGAGARAPHPTCLSPAFHPGIAGAGRVRRHTGDRGPELPRQAGEAAPALRPANDEPGLAPASGPADWASLPAGAHPGPAAPSANDLGEAPCAELWGGIECSVVR